MPELPDLDILADAFHASLAGRPIIGSTSPQTLMMRGTAAGFAALVGHTLQRVTQRGKFLVLDLGGDQLVMNPMITGRLGIAAPATRPFPSTAFVLRLDAALHTCRATRPMDSPCSLAPG